MATRLDEVEAAEVRALAAGEGRSESAMLRRLAVEAMVARRAGSASAAELVRAGRVADARRAAGEGEPSAEQARVLYESRPPAAGRHVFAPGGPNGRCGASGCGMQKLAAVHRG